MTWFDAIPVALVSIAWLAGPGLVISYVLGLRGVAAWALAPVAGVCVLATTAAAADKLGLAWSLGLVLGAFAIVAALVGLGAFVLRRRYPPAREPDPRRVSLAAVAGLVPAILLGAVTIVRGFGRPDSLSQTYDAAFHYNAVAWILESRNASSLTIVALGNPDIPKTFYPAAWHDVTSLVVMSSGTSISAAANLVAAVIALVVWPLSCLLLARQIFGRSAAALAVTGVLSIGFTAFPWGLLGFGVLWPNSLGLAMTPAVLAVVVTLAGWAKDDALGRGRAWLALPAGLLACGFAHPNVLFSLVVLAVFPVGAALLKRAWRLHRERRTFRGAGEVFAFLALLGLAWVWAATTPAFERVRTMYWPPFETPSRAVGEVLLNAPNQSQALWLLSAVMLVGVVAAVRRVELRWVVAGHAVTGFLYLMTASLNRPDTQKFTGYWYNDPFRLAAMLPITGIPLVVAGILFLAKKIAERVPDPARARITAVASVSTLGVVAVAITLALVGLTRGLYPDQRASWVTMSYAVPDSSALVDQDTRDFFARIAPRIPEDSVVAGNPWDGSVALWGLTGRRTLFSHFEGAFSAEQRYLAQHLTDAVADPEACRAIRRLNVGYLVIGDAQFWVNDQRRKSFPGFADPWTKPGFQLIDSDGAKKLYRITACGATPGTIPAG